MICTSDRIIESVSGASGVKSSVQSAVRSVYVASEGDIPARAAAEQCSGEWREWREWREWQGYSR